MRDLALVHGDPSQPPQWATLVRRIAHSWDVLVRFEDGSVEMVPAECCEAVENA